jgi:hypothetical protein
LLGTKYQFGPKQNTIFDPKVPLFFRAMWGDFEVKTTLEIFYNSIYLPEKSEPNKAK